MRRKDRQINESAHIGEILRQAQVGRVGLCLDNRPYVVPVNFVFEDNKIYFHSAPQGQKIDYLRANPNVCFEVDEHRGTIKATKPRRCATYYRSVIAFGTARCLEDPERKRIILGKLLDKYAPGHYLAPPTLLEAKQVAIVEITIKEMTGKERHPFYPGDRVRFAPLSGPAAAGEGEAKEALAWGQVSIVAGVDRDGRVHLGGVKGRFRWEDFEKVGGKTVERQGEDSHTATRPDGGGRRGERRGSNRSRGA